MNTNCNDEMSLVKKNRNSGFMKKLSLFGLLLGLSTVKIRGLAVISWKIAFR